MFTLLLKKEIRDILNSPKFSVLFGMGSLLILLAFYMGARNYQVLQSQYESAVRENLRQLEGVTDWSRVEPQIHLPPSPLASLISGVSNDIGRSVQVQAGAAELIPDHTRYGEDPVYAAFRLLDLEFVFQLILSLVAILLAYNAVNGEREQGTLKLMMAHAVPKDKVIFAKLVGSFTATALPLLVPILIGCGILMVMNVPLTGAEWLRLMLIVCSGMLYYFVFLSVSILVSSLTARSAHAFLALLIIWIFTVLIVPRTAVLLAGRAIEVPSVDEINSQKFRHQSQLFNEHFQKIGDFKPSSNDPEKAMNEFNEFMDKARADREKKVVEFNERLNEDRDNRQKIQQQWAFALGRISPATSFSLAAMQLAGTSSELRNRFEESVKSYKQTFKQFVFEKTGKAPGGNMMMIRIGDSPEEKPKPINPYDLPQFVMPSLTFSEIINSALPDMAILIVINMLIFAATTAAFLRYDVR